MFIKCELKDNLLFSKPKIDFIYSVLAEVSLTGFYKKSIYNKLNIPFLISHLGVA